jgi:hypothetical protein
VIAGAVLTGVAVDRQDTAQSLERSRDTAGGVSEADADRFDDAVSQRDDYRAVAITAFGVSAPSSPPASSSTSSTRPA